MARVKSLAGKSIEQYDSPNKGAAMTGHKGIVLHIAQGTYKGTISWQNNPDQRYADGTQVNTCSTFIVGRDLGEWAQMVDSARIAWCQRGGSRDWLSIELAGYAPNPPTAWQIEACAQLLAWGHRTHGFPVAVADNPSGRGLGHHSMDREWLGEEWGHDSCPGSGVIAAKDDIVKRAQAILAGEDDDVGTDDVWNKTYREYADENRDGQRDFRTAGDFLVSTHAGVVDARATAQQILSVQQAILAAVAGDDSAAIIAEIKRQSEQTRAALAGAQSAILTALPDGDGPVSRDDLIAALRTVLGSVDNPPAS